MTDILVVLIYGRILFPTSKLGTYEYSKKMLEKYDFSQQDIYRALEVTAKEKDYMLSLLYVRMPDCLLFQTESLIIFAEELL